MVEGMVLEVKEDIENIKLIIMNEKINYYFYFFSR